MTATDAHRTIDAVWRIESATLIAGLTRIVRDVGLAEELAQDALVAALEQWPADGVPASPGAWLMATAKHRAIDRIRRSQVLERKREELGRDLESRQTEPDFAAAMDEDEDIEARTFDLREARDMVRRGEITDMKSVAGLAMI